MICKEERSPVVGNSFLLTRFPPDTSSWSGAVLDDDDVDHVHVFFFFSLLLPREVISSDHDDDDSEEALSSFVIAVGDAITRSE